MAGSSWSARCGAACLAIAMVGCRPAGDTGRTGTRTVSVAAAADLRVAFEEISADFRTSHPDVHVSSSYGSSGAFYSQLLNQAPFDLFLSADAEYPRKLAEASLTVQASEFVYGVGRIVVWAPHGSAIEVERLGMGALTHPSVTHVAIANPRHAPYGRAAEAAMKSFGVYESVAGRLVFGENVSQTLQFVGSGNAQVGIIALSLALAPPDGKSGRYWEVPAGRYPRLEQAGVMLRWARDKDAAMALRAFMMEPAGRRILAKYGFLQPAD